jgi:LacI family transcriptional regulator
VKATINDIAKRAGVSDMTVSNVLGNRGRFGKGTRRRVLDIASELGYRPNASARAIRHGRFGCAALVLSTAEQGRSVLPDGMLLGITEALEANEMHLSVACLPDVQLTDERFLPKILREWLSDGMLINYNRKVPERMLELIRRFRIPAVWLNRKGDRNCAYPDDFGAGRRAAEMLLELGHRRLAYVGFTSVREDEEPHYSVVDRPSGFVEAVRQAGLPEPPVIDAPHLRREKAAQRTDLLAEMLRQDDRPTGLATYSSGDAFHAVRAAERLGMSVPQDLSLIVFGGPVVYVGQQTDALLVPTKEVGAAAVEMLLWRIEHPTETVASRAIPFEYRPGQTTAPAPA